MPKRKLTSKLLESIELYAEDNYTLEDIFDELNISKDLIKNEHVLHAFERGLIKLFILLASNGVTDDEIIIDNPISQKQCTIWREQFSDEIEKGLQKKKDDEELATKQFSNPLMSGMVNILEQNGQGSRPVSEEVLSEDIKQIVEKTQSGDTKALITILTTNILQLQLFNGTVTRNLMGDAGKHLDNFNKLSNMQLKVMQETRKSIMAINEITNPKRTTFIKEANQHNHLHQISEKKDESQNELQKHLETPNEIVDTGIYVSKEKENEKK